MFDIFDESGVPCGTASRDAVHRRGLWHRAANVFLFSTDGRLLLQRRQLTKDVCPGAWDLSVAEHLRPGESFAAGAVRGLREELGVSVTDLEPLGGVTRARLDIESLGIRDYEFQQSFTGTFDGTVSPANDEVMETRYIALAELAAELDQHPEKFTPWLMKRTAELGILDSAVPASRARHDEAGGGES